jgi:NADH dehydrogenase (ubiquinone) Fe-S protein 6
MLPRLAARTALRLPQRVGVAQRAFATSSPRLIEAKEAILNHKAETTPEAKSEEDSLGVTENEERGIQQAPNRRGIWSRSQKPRAKAMTGPRFEQTDFDLQVGISESRGARTRC